MSELTSGAVMLASTLTPLALHLGTSCLRMVRDARKIKKNVLCIPSKGGKSFLKASIKDNNILIVDVDEFLKDFNDPEAVSRLELAKTDGLLHEHDLYYQEASLKPLEFVKKLIKKNHKLRVLFITSSYSFASLFRNDAVCVASPDSEFWEKILMERDPVERELLRKQRQYMLDAVPKSAVNPYHTYDELETMVRGRLGLVRHL